MKKLSGIERKVNKEFPWLWAVNDRATLRDGWAGITIKVLVARVDIFDQDIRSGEKVWVYGISEKTGLPALSPSLGNPFDHRVGAGVWEAVAVVGERIEYVAVQSVDKKSIKIYRAPKGTSMWKFISRYHR